MGIEQDDGRLDDWSVSAANEAAPENSDHDGGLLSGERETTSDDRRKDRRGVRRALMVLAILLAVVLIGGLAVGGWYLSRVDHALSKIERGNDMLPTSAPTVAEAGKGDQRPLNFILMGSDSRGPDQGRSDVLMTAYVPSNRQHVYLVSYPRDLWVPVRGHGNAKINAAYAFGGPALAVETVQNYTGVKVDHVALVNFEKFMALTETLGGVTVDNKVPSTSGDGKFYWPQGKVTLKGEEALTYVRQRKELPNGDLDRAERQRAVVKAIIDKLTSKQVLTNPGKFDQNAQALAGSIKVDDKLSNKVMRDMAMSMRINSGDDIVSLQAPINGFSTSPDKQSIALPDESSQRELSQAMKDDTMDDFWSRNKGRCSFDPTGC